jgi:hypothetical protein
MLRTWPMGCSIFRPTGLPPTPDTLCNIFTHTQPDCAVPPAFYFVRQKPQLADR